jgi:phosphatidylinositol alpha 1,6-mannosyltransferase
MPPPAANISIGLPAKTGVCLLTAPRVAFFTDSFHEVNGVARTSREFARFAQEQNHPFFSVHTGPQTVCWTEDSLTTYELKLSWASLRLETDLFLDLLFFRHLSRLGRALRQFRPDLVHVTGPGHCGLLGAILAHRLRIPLVASWHTNVHEYGARRLARLLRMVPAKQRADICSFVENKSLDIVLWFYRFARILFAPNPELVNLLQTRTGHPAFLMQRGIDTHLFSPEWRQRSDDEFVIGYVGRLSSEKNIRLLVELEKRLVAAGIHNYRFLVVGDGGDREWLAAHLQKGHLPGILKGKELARTYASMDVFVFPSTTDTFGNVVLEAMASGVPPVVSAEGGPKYIIRPDMDGLAASDIDEFTRYVLALYNSPELRQQMSRNARQRAFTFSWKAVFEDVYARYEEAHEAGLLRPAATLSRPAAHVPGRLGSAPRPYI